MNRVLEIIKGLKKLGPRIALDDFGTGYSSLNYIKQLPLDLIKVDKTFIDDILEDEYAQAFVRLIVELSKPSVRSWLLKAWNIRNSTSCSEVWGCIIYRDSILENRQLQKILNKST